jgi:shikimate dehydrogenase
VSRLPGRLVLLGHPVAHSLSPRFQNAALSRAGIPLVYEALDVLPEALGRTLTDLRSSGGAGNVTIPHKESAATQCDELTSVARRVGAVNTFWCEGERLVGDNTDVGGFEAVATALLRAADQAHPLRIAVLGAGGSAAAVLAAAEGWPRAHARVFSRSAVRTRALCARFSGLADAAPTAEEAVSGATLVVNATPIGLGDDAMPIDPTRLAPSTVVVDLVYRHGGTAWTCAATRLGLRATDGTLVLLEQGALAFERWFGVTPDRDAMRAALSL